MATEQSRQRDRLHHRHHLRPDLSPHRPGSRSTSADLAEYVDAKMRAVAAQGRTVDSLRVAVLAALNLADELSQAARRRCAPGPRARRQL